MTNMLVSTVDFLLFVILPYVVLIAFFGVSIWRYRFRPFTVTSLSSQFLENREHFWGLVPFHYGIILVLSAHILALFFPKTLLAWNQVPWRLYLLETTGVLLGLMTLVGITGLIYRRLHSPKVKRVTSRLDWLLLLILLVQVVTGVWIAIGYRWGSSWFASSVAPYLWSLAKFNPQLEFVASQPVIIKLHIVNAFVFIGIFSFSRLIHVLVTPNPYLWRRPQVVRWYRPGRSD